MAQRAQSNYAKTDTRQGTFDPCLDKPDPKTKDLMQGRKNAKIRKERQKERRAFPSLRLCARLGIITLIRNYRWYHMLAGGLWLMRMDDALALRAHGLARCNSVS